MEIDIDRPDREPDLALRFWTDGIGSHLSIDAGPQDVQMTAQVLRHIAEIIENSHGVSLN